MHMTAPVQEADQLMPMMLASLGGHLPSERHLMQMMLAFLGCTCQAKVPLMLGSSPADADDARFFGRHLPNESSPDEDDTRFYRAHVEEAAQMLPMMLISLGAPARFSRCTCRRSSPADADDVRLSEGQLPNESPPDADDARAVLQEAALLMRMMLACLWGHLPSKTHMMEPAQQTAQLILMMLASLGGTCQAKVALMPMMLASLGHL